MWCKWWTKASLWSTGHFSTPHNQSDIPGQISSLWVSSSLQSLLTLVTLELCNARVCNARICVCSFIQVIQIKKHYWDGQTSSGSGQMWTFCPQQLSTWWALGIRYRMCWFTEKEKKPTLPHVLCIMSFDLWLIVNPVKHCNAKVINLLSTVIQKESRGLGPNWPNLHLYIFLLLSLDDTTFFSDRLCNRCC